MVVMEFGPVILSGRHLLRNRERRWRMSTAAEQAAASADAGRTGGSVFARISKAKRLRAAGRRLVQGVPG
jgi:hypothetical protein